MVRPYYYPRGRILETGVPELYLDERRTGGKVSKRDIIRFGLKNNDRMNRQDWLQQYWKTHTLSPWQKKAGARLII